MSHHADINTYDGLVATLRKVLDATAGEDVVLRARSLMDELIAWREGGEALGFITANPRKSLLAYARAAEKHHEEHHLREAQLVAILDIVLPKCAACGDWATREDVIGKPPSGRHLATRYTCDAPACIDGQPGDLLRHAVLVREFLKMRDGT